MKIFTSCIFWFLIGFIVGPIVVVESFGHYTQWRIERMDAENAQRLRDHPDMKLAMQKPHYTAEDIAEMETAIHEYFEQNKPENKLLHPENP